ncbi:hypothetical protein [Nitrososphaera sp. AFS]|uniref:hypothetical protein n=1 Tax=Nitrososphaera sp. AFS TaxID=2301191 RepID=UPI00139242F9|nr:hypothetical protein [Nitrososphaera sp. AFS]NAL78037.1 hypothetical protein [Nitrososphaera sp. AFS]
MSQNNSNSDDDRLIKIIQSSTRNLMSSFRNKTESLSKCSDDIQVLLRKGYDVETAKETAVKLFGKQKVSFIAIDGTESQDKQLDMLIFYAGAFGYTGQLEFVKNGCSCGEILEMGNTANVSTAVPIHEEDASNVAAEITEGGVEVDPERLPSILMQFAEYYMAVKSLYQDPDLKLVILDRTLAGEVGHLMWSVDEMLNERKCVLQGIETEFGIVSPLDLELARMLHPNDKLQIPVARSHLIKFAAINKLISLMGNGITSISYEELLRKIDAKPQRLEKLVKDLAKFDERFSILKEDTHASNNYSVVVKQEIKDYWQRVFSAVMMVARHIFDTPEDKHPLIYEEYDVDVNKQKKWITSTDLEYMTLIMIYALVRMAWEKKVLIIGLIKDTAAAELSKAIVPVLQNANKIRLSGTAGCIGRLPNFNTDKQLLQIASIINGQSIKAPWRTFEFDSCFRTIAPVVAAKSEPFKKNEAKVKGAHKNVISAERMFVKSYIQLWQSENDITVRSHVFTYDRPCYPGFDIQGELLLQHLDGNVEEEIQPIIHFDKDCEISHLVMDILCSMALEVIPEAIGHNYPLFLADKKAKSVLGQMRSAYLSTVALVLANSEFDQQILYEQKFRDFRTRIENSRRERS